MTKRRSTFQLSVMRITDKKEFRRAYLRKTELLKPYIGENVRLLHDIIAGKDRLYRLDSVDDGIYEVSRGRMCGSGSVMNIIPDEYILY